MELYNITERVDSSATAENVELLISPYKQQLDAAMNEVIGRAARSMTKRKPESPLGNWVADVLMTEARNLYGTEVDAAVQNYGGIRISEIPSGNITVGKIYELMPFDNMLVLVEMNGTQVQQFFNKIAADGGWPVSAEVHFTARGENAQNLQLSQTAIDPEGQYKIAMPDYIANGGGDMAFLKPLARQNSGMQIRDLLIKYIRDKTYNNQKIESYISGRIYKGS